MGLVCLYTVKMEGLFVPLLLLLISLPSTIYGDHCRPRHEDYNAGTCFLSVIGKTFGVLGAIGLLSCCIAAFIKCPDDDDEDTAAPDLETGEVEVKTTLINKPNQQSVKAGKLEGVDREKTTVGSKANQQALESLLRTSASRGELEGVTALLDTGVWVDAKDEEGQTAL